MPLYRNPEGAWLRMKFIKKDMNRRLLVLIIFFLVIFIVFTVYATQKLRLVLANRGTYDKNAAKFTAQAIFEQLNKTNKSLELAVIDKAVLESKLNEAIQENEKLHKMVKEYGGQVLLLKAQIEYYGLKSWDDSSAQFTAYYRKMEEINQLKEQIKSLCLVIKSSNATAGECRYVSD